MGEWSETDDSKPEVQGSQQVAEAESRDRFINKLAKRAGISGDALSPLSVVTVSQPRQGSKLLDFTKNNIDELKEKVQFNDREETNWEKFEKPSGK